MGFGGLYISLAGIYANKKALDTISHNIANANNKSYVRQSVIHAETGYKSISGGYRIGSGVTVQQIRQIRDEFLDLKLRNEKSSYGYFNTRSEILGEIESIFNEITNSGFQSVMDDFWNGWSELYKEPESLTMRALVHESAEALKATVNNMSQQLINLQYNINKEILSKTEEVNGILREIARLNKSIKMAESFDGVSANDYRDTLNEKLDRLSELLPIKYYENNYGEVIVSINGRDLVDGDHFNSIKIDPDGNGNGELCWAVTGEKIDLRGKGELAGYIEARDEIVVEYKNRLDILVKTLADNINQIHRTGYGLDGSQGNDFFIYDESNPSGTLRINPDLSDFNKIAASSTGLKGDGQIVKEIMDLREKLMFNDYEFGNYEYPPSNNEGTLKIDEFYRDLVLNLSIKREEARNIAENQDLLIAQMDERKQEISGVSLDEEMANMLTYQHSYIANSRVINALDQMIDNMINKMGVVGR